MPNPETNRTRPTCVTKGPSPHLSQYASGAAQKLIIIIIISLIEFLVILNNNNPQYWITYNIIIVLFHVFGLINTVWVQTVKR